MIGTLPPALSDLCNRYRLNESGRLAVQMAYKVFRSHHGPFITSISAKMLPDLRRDAEDGRTVTFLGRDGHSLSLATMALQPEFFTECCTVAVISRIVADAALQDREAYLKSNYSDVEGFRDARHKVPPNSVAGAYRNLTGYLLKIGIPIMKDGGKVTLVNTSFKGTVQELLSAAYPGAHFIGRYAFFGASPRDPHPGTKFGYVVDLPAERTASGQGIPFSSLPVETELTFACKEAIAVIEHTLHGPLVSPQSITGSGPTQHGESLGRDPAKRPSLDVIDARFRDPTVREAVKAAALLAVYDAALEVAANQDVNGAWLRNLADKENAFTMQVRSWIMRDSMVDPELRIVLDSLVPRSGDGPLLS